MTSLLQIARVLRANLPMLAAGGVLAILSTLALAGLVLAAGSVPVALGGAAVAVALRVLGVGRVVLRYGERLLTHSATFEALATLRVRLFGALARQSPGGLGFMRRGDALSRLVNDVDALDGLYLRIAVPLLASLVLLPVLAFALGRQDAAVAATVCGLFACAVLVIPGLAARSSLSQGGQLAVAAAALRVAVVDTFAGMREVRAFGNEGRMLAQVQAREAAMFAAQRRVMRRAGLAQAASVLCAQFALLIVLVVPEPASAVFPAVLLTLAAFEVAGAMPRAGALAGHAAAAAARVLESGVGETRPVDTGPATTMATAAGAPGEAVVPAGSSIRLEGVSYGWPGRPPLFDGLVMDIPAGSRVAILGPSGAGKSTLAALMLKVVQPQAGRVLLGGADIALLPEEAVWRRIAWLGQGTHVFNDTLRENLLLGRPGADDAALWQALAVVGLDEVARALPEQLDTWLGDEGTGLSGGQRRRVALARVLLSPAPVLILDEPATGMDDAAERNFLATLNEATAGRTVILIVHRLLGMEQIDRIWRLTGGRAVAATG